MQNAYFYGQITLELENQSGFTIVLKKGVRVCPFVFVQISQSAEKPFSGKNGGQSGATASLLEVDPEFS